jgi:hypothetical protein
LGGHGNHSKNLDYPLSSPSVPKDPSSQYPSSEVSSPEDRDKSLLKCFEDEFSYLSSCPTTSLTKPLVFVNDPDFYGEFTPPPFDEMLMGNSGKYALCPYRQANEAFIYIEYRCCNILAHLGNIEGTEERDALALAISDHLVYLNHQKGVQWAQHRGANTVPAAQGATSGLALLVVNTGEKKLFSLSILLFFSYHKMCRTTFLSTRTSDTSSKGSGGPHTRSAKLLFSTSKGPSYPAWWDPRYHSRCRKSTLGENDHQLYSQEPKDLFFPIPS